MISGSLFAQDDWELKKDKSGIKVYTKEVADNPLKKSKATVSFAATVDEVKAVIFDYDRYTEWTPRCISAEKVREENGAIISYSLSDSPWPVSNRDLVLKNEVKERPDGTVFIYMTAVDDPDVHPESSAVRMTFFEGFYKISPRGNDVQITYEALLDPAGSIPAWMANMAVVDTPFDLLDELRSQVQK
jgi:hypothetical protein